MILVTTASKLGYVPESAIPAVVTAVMAREELGSTGLTNGVAIPHTKQADIQRTICLVARSKNGVAFDAIDGEPVFIFFMLLSPKDDAAGHLAALAYISRVVRDSKFVKFLQDAKDVAEIRQLLDEADETLT